MGIRNSNNKRFPISTVFGNRVFVCDNLAFSGEIQVSKRHTKNGHTRWKEGILDAIHGLSIFREQEAQRIAALKEKELTTQQSDSIILSAYKANLVGSRLLPKLINEYENPRHEVYKPRNSWSLLNAYNEVCKDRFKRYPHRTASAMIEFQSLCA